MNPDDDTLTDPNVPVFAPLLGCKPDTIDERDFRYETSDLVATAPVVTKSSIDSRHFDPYPRILQIAQDCTGHGGGSTIVCAARAAGHTIKKPSSLFLYSNAQLLEPIQAGRPRLLDIGARLRNLFKAVAPKKNPQDDAELAGYGVIAEERWPEIPANVSVAPPEDCYRAGENATVKAYHRIPDGKTSPELLLAALQREQFSTICIMWDDQAINIGSQVYKAPAGTVYGGHCLSVQGYLDSLNAFIVRNSHGPEFGFEGGYMLLHWDYVARHSFDKWVPTVAPEVIT